ncbi:MAG: diguanylate cyclase [Pseudomonadota bacterium]
MKILVADDSKTNRALITDSLNKLGHDVLPAKSGEEAIEIFKGNRPDLILLDVVMGGMDGFECAKRIREIDSTDWIPIIFISTSVDDESISRGINAGGDDYLAKPFSNITLAAKIKAMQRISDMRQKLFEYTQVLQTLSRTDSLTGLNNRFQFDIIIQEKINHANHHGSMFAVLFLDLDHFKEINDNFGHQAGDLLIKNVALRLKSCLRLSDFIARMGGDEFAIILSEIEDVEIVNHVAHKIIAELTTPYNLLGNQVTVSSSIGSCIYPTDGTKAEELMRNADTSMYYAKEMGRNNYKAFNKKLVKDKG